MNQAEPLLRLGRWADAERVLTQGLAGMPEGVLVGGLGLWRAELAAADELTRFGLTDRECEVLALLAVGLSNPEIAALCSSVLRRSACMSPTSWPSWASAAGWKPPRSRTASEPPTRL